METLKNRVKSNSEIYKALKNSETFIFPTDTVLGIGCLVDDSVALDKIYDIKGRDKSKPCLIHVSKRENIEKYVHVPEKAKKVIDKFLPGNLTLILNKISGLKTETLSELNTIGVRFVDNETLLSFLTDFDIDILGTSANLSGDLPPKSYDMLQERLLERVNSILYDDNFISKNASTIVDFTNENEIKLLRQGDLDFNKVLDFYNSL